jgi:hypothetical protein
MRTFTLCTITLALTTKGRTFWFPQKNFHLFGSQVVSYSMERIIKVIKNPSKIIRYLDLKKRLLKFSGTIALKILKSGRIIKLPLSVKGLVTAHLMRIGEPRHTNAKAFIAVLKYFEGTSLHMNVALLLHLKVLRPA